MCAAPAAMQAFVPHAPLRPCRRHPRLRALCPRARGHPFRRVPHPARLVCVSAAASGPPSSSNTSESPPPASPPPPAPAHKSDFRARFGDLRGKAVEPVSASVARFNAAFRRPVPIVYRGIINELLTTTHLATVCAMWRFDAVFAFGFDQVFAEFLRYYPDPAERALLYRCCADALGLDQRLLQDTAAAVADWVDGKTEEDVFAAIAAASPNPPAESVGPVIEALAYIRDAGDFDWYYSRLFGIGLIQVMSAVGVELTVANAEAWADKIGLEKSKFTADMGAYLSSMERLKQAEQIFAESTAREAKKTAERLAERAEAAAKEADALEKEGVDDVQGGASGEAGEPAAQDPSSSSA